LRSLLAGVHAGATKVQYGASHSRSMLVQSLPLPLLSLSRSLHICSDFITIWHLPLHSLGYVRTCMSQRPASCCERACVSCANGKKILCRAVSHNSNRLVVVVVVVGFTLILLVRSRMERSVQQTQYTLIRNVPQRSTPALTLLCTMYLVLSHPISTSPEEDST